MIEELKKDVKRTKITETMKEKKQLELDYGLILAVHNDLRMLVDVLLEKGANINFINPSVSGSFIYETCLAIKKKNLSLAKDLFSKGAFINNPNSSLCAPLINAMENNDVDSVKFLLENGAKVDGYKNELRSQTFLGFCLYRAKYPDSTRQEKELYQIAQLLLDYGADFKQSISRLEKEIEEKGE